MRNGFNLERFITAQENSYADALEEIKRGRKQSHWMWYIFPQLKGLGQSSMSGYYGIGGIDEAKAYLADSILGTRLIEISTYLLDISSDNPVAVMGKPDDLKLRSSMTLFMCADSNNHVFKAVINKFFRGEYCQQTLSLLGLTQLLSP